MSVYGNRWCLWKKEDAYIFVRSNRKPIGIDGARGGDNQIGLGGRDDLFGDVKDELGVRYVTKGD